MFLLEQLLPAVLVTLLTAGGLLATVVVLWKGSRWAGALALGAGYAGGHLMTAGRPAFPPAEATQWLPYFVILGVLIGVLDSVFRVRRGFRVLGWLVVCAGLLRLLLLPKFQYGWSLWQGVLWIAGLTTGMLFLAWCFEEITRRDDRAIGFLLILTIVAGGTSAALMLSGSMLLGQLAIVLCASAGGILALAWLLPQAAGLGGMVPVALLLFASLWISGYFYAELPAASALFLAGSPALALVIPGGSERDVWRPLMLRAGVVVVAVAIAVLLAFLASPSLDY